MQTSSSRIDNVPSAELARLAAGDCGSVERDGLLDRLIADRLAARELQLMLSLESAAGDLVAQLQPAASPLVVRKWRMLLPIGAAALMLGMWPHRTGHAPAETVASLNLQEDVLLSGSFEAANDRFTGGFE